jgi:hypothetical protein
VRLWRSPQAPPVVAVGALTFSSFAVHSSMDYVAEFPGVLAAMALILGVATATPDDQLQRLYR